MKDNSKFGSSQSLIDSVNEVLKGGQKKLDKNYNGKLDGEDFKKLRGVKEDEDDDDGWYTHKEIHGNGGVSRADWKKGIRTPKDADAAYDAANAAAAKARASRVARVRQDAEKLRQRNSKPVKESALGDLLGSEKGVKKIAPRKDEYGNEIKNPARSLARKAMKSFAAKAKELPMRKEEAELDEGAFSSGALKASEKFKREAKKIQSTGTYIGKDGKGVFTSKTVNGKEISRTYEEAVMKAIKSIRAKRSTEC